MVKPQATAAVVPLDPLLRPYAEAVDEATVARLREELLSQTDGLVKGVIGKKLRVAFNRFGEAQGADVVDTEGAQNVYGDVQLQLLEKLVALRTGAAQAIGDWRGFVTVVTRNRLNDFLRRKYPRRFSLENKVLFLLDNHPDFARWEDGGAGRVAGYAVWRNGRRSQALDDLSKFAHERWPQTDLQRLALADLVDSLFRWVGAPLALDELVRSIAELQQLKEIEQVSATPDAADEEADLLLQLPDPQPGSERLLVLKRYLQRIWETVAAMSRRHRCALLLNLRDETGGNALRLFPATVASLGQMAQLLELSKEEFAALWPRLPLSDLEIAQLLACERDQIISCRKSVRRVLEKIRAEFE